MLYQALLLVFSIIILYFGAEIALEAAEKIGVFFGLSPLVIGLFIIGFGTSLPEFFVSQLACYNGYPAIAIGNVVGSNIANLFLILGLCGIFTSLNLKSKELKRQIYIHLGITLILIAILSLKKINFMTMTILNAFFLIYMLDTFLGMRRKKIDSKDSVKREHLKLSIFLKLIIGFTFLYLGGELLVNSGSSLGKLLGISDYVISAIFLAFGTSFPELVTTVIASYRKKSTDLIVGNILGSNIFNIALVLGSLGVYNFNIEGSYIYEIVLLLFGALILIFLSFLKRKFDKLPAAVFIIGYIMIIFKWLA